MKTILIVDDEQDIIDLLKYNLTGEGYRVLAAGSGREALALARSFPDLILLDVMMPEIDGWEVVRQLKRNKETADIPVLFLTARGGETDEVIGLELGAEDYITKPIAIRTLLARVRSVLRRHSSAAVQPVGSEPIHVDDMIIDPMNYEVRIGSRICPLPRKEFQTLYYLASHQGRILTREQILDAVWGEDVHVVDRTVDVHIRKIREKLGRHAGWIETVKGVGYRFKETGT